MSFFTFIESKVKNIHWYDISLVKLSTMAFTLMIAKLWPPILNFDWSVYLIICILAAIRPGYVFFIRK
tara:strand:- start:681 stop:884 length:204 start_codon:yes stop_codon:yes gene_type:complete